MTAIIFIVGLFLGSFVGVIVGRAGKKKSIFWSRSQCDFCQQPLGALELIPILSFVWLAGKCRHCRRKISLFYPAIELATGALLALNWHFLNRQSENWFTIMLYSIIVGGLIVAAVIDLDRMEVPDGAVLVIIAIAVLLMTSRGNYPDALAGALTGGGFLALLALMGRGKWMGWGDVKLAASLGLVLGFYPVIAMLFLSFILGSIISLFLVSAKIKTLKSHIPFAPFIALSALLVIWLNWSILDLL